MENPEQIAFLFYLNSLFGYCNEAADYDEELLSDIEELGNLVPDEITVNDFRRSIVAYAGTVAYKKQLQFHEIKLDLMPPQIIKAIKEYVKINPQDIAEMMAE